MRVALFGEKFKVLEEAKLKTPKTKEAFEIASRSFG